MNGIEANGARFETTGYVMFYRRRKYNGVRKDERVGARMERKREEVGEGATRTRRRRGGVRMRARARKITFHS